jgi:hypothetical protein
MIATTFPQANARYGHPSDLAPEQVAEVPAFTGLIQGGSLDGQPIVITAWRPEPDDVARLMSGGLLFVGFIGGLPPHLVTTDFEQARHPA